MKRPLFAVRLPRFPILLALLTLGVLLAGACERIAPVRTLPSWVRGIYIPMFENQSYEPALEEQATILTQEAFLADGRLDVVRRDQADLVLLATIVDWRNATAGTTGDKIVDRERIEMTVDVGLYDPFDAEKPLARLAPIRVVGSFNSDERSVDYVPEPDRRQQMLELMARRVMNETITGFPREAGGLPGPENYPRVLSPEEVQLQQLDAARARRNQFD